MMDAAQFFAYVSTIVAGFTTVAYTVGTFLLWRVTLRSTRSTERQLELTEAASRASIVDEIYRSHREIISRLLPPAYSFEAFWQGRSSCTEGSLSDGYDALYGSILINHAARLYQHRAAGFLDDLFWQGAELDVRGLFQNPSIARRWEAVKKYHPIDFQNFIDRLLKKSVPTG